MSVDALVVAGGAPPPEDPLYVYTQGRPKAMLWVAGQPMVQWVLDALEVNDHVERVVVVGLDEAMGLQSSKVLAYVPDQGNMLANARAGLQRLRLHESQPRRVLLLASDIPALRSEMIDWALAQDEGETLDAVYFVVRREVMTQRFPGVQRTYVRFKDVEVCGADVHLISSHLAAPDLPLWERLVAARKSPRRLAALLGWQVLLKLLLHTATLSEAQRLIARRLGVRAKAVLSPYAEMAMDGDRPEQIEMLRRALRSRKPSAARRAKPPSASPQVFRDSNFSANSALPFSPPLPLGLARGQKGRRAAERGEAQGER